MYKSFGKRLGYLAQHLKGIFVVIDTLSSANVNKAFREQKLHNISFAMQESWSKKFCRFGKAIRFRNCRR